MLFQIDSLRIIDVMWAITIDTRRFGNSKGPMLMTRKNMIVF